MSNPSYLSTKGKSDVTSSNLLVYGGLQINVSNLIITPAGKKTFCAFSFFYSGLEDNLNERIYNCT